MDGDLKQSTGDFARAHIRCRRAAEGVQRAVQRAVQRENAERDRACGRVAAWGRCYRQLLEQSPRTLAELLRLGDQAEAYLQPTLDGGAGDGSIDPESATLVRLIEGQRAVLEALPEP